MNIGILTSTNQPLRQQLDASGSRNAQAQPASDEVAAAVAKPRPIVNVAPSIRYPSMRAALDARIAADVSAGQLSAGDAATVGKTLDAIDRRAGSPAGSDPISTAAFLAGRAMIGTASSTDNSAQVAQAYLATIGRGTLVDRFA